MLLFAFSTIIFVGNSALVSRFLGANDKKAANEVVMSLSFAAFVFSLPLMLSAFWGFEFFFAWIGIESQAHEIGSSYLSIKALFPTKIIVLKAKSNIMKFKLTPTATIALAPNVLMLCYCPKTQERILKIITI